MPYQIEREEKPTTGRALPVEAAKDADERHAALWDTHAARLHGFALLLTVGDEPRATAAAVAALEAGEHAAEMPLREGAAGWLRREVISELRRTWPTPNLLPAERRGALRRMGVTEPLMSSIESISADGRAALVAGAIEGLGMPDVAITLDTDLAGARRAVEEARREYLAAAAQTAAPEPAPTPGPLAQRIGEMTAPAVEPLPVKEPA